MPSWHELTQQLPQSIHSVIHFLKARRREEASIGLAAFLFWVGHAFSGWLPPELVEFLKPWHVTLIAQSVCYVVGLVLLVYSGYRLWHLVSVPPLPPEQTRPSAIKGPMAFTDDDGELFRKLGRGHDLQKLLGFILDNQVPMVILMGASGVGKTSLLRAGLTHVLANRDVQYHYWEAVPTVSGERLLRAIQETWQEKASSTGDGVAQHTTAHVPTTLDDLVNPSSELCRHTNHVIVLDQFEQLRGRNPVFRLLRRVAREAKPPHRITWVVAFRREFRADWSDFIIPEQERGFFPPEISLQLFTVAQAQDIVGQLIHDAHLSIEQSVVDNMIAAATVDGEVWLRSWRRPPPSAAVRRKTPNGRKNKAFKSLGHYA